MKLDPCLWEALVEHGVTEAHLEMLLRLLRVQRNGFVAWRFVHGHLTQCDMQMVFPSRAYDIQKITETMLADGSSLLR